MEIKKYKASIEKINEILSWVFDNINKIDKYLAKLKEQEGGTNYQCQELKRRHHYRSYRL